MNNNILQMEVAARRVVWLSSENNDIAGPTGANSPIENKAKNDALSNGRSPEIFPDYLAQAHERMAHALALTLNLGEPDDWARFGLAVRVHLTIFERAALAVAALRSLPDDCALDTAAAALGAVGAPLPSFLGRMDEARHWANLASRGELKAYALASFEAMAPKDRAKFLHHVRTLEVAA
jgi:hypothetical protein